MLSQKRWLIAPPAPPEFVAALDAVPPLVAQILFNRGFTHPREALAFLAGTPQEDNPFLLTGLERAVRVLRDALRRKHRIAVYGDYDADGITATAVLVQVLRSLGGDVIPYIPDRNAEGYGLNTDAIEFLAAQGVRVLVTVDCGSRSLPEVALAQKRGMRVVITDHHHLGTALPVCEALITPRREDNTYPCRDLAGVGVAFKLAQALLRTNARVPLPGTCETIPESALLDLVALGTVADMVPLLGENHRLVRAGLVELNAARRPGIHALLQVSGVKPGEVTANTISFALAPRINAAGRIGQAYKALELLLAKDMSMALPLAETLERLNRERQDLTLIAYQQARDLVNPQVKAGAALLFAAARNFPAGIIGLAAARLMDEFYRPVVVVEVGDTYSRGSARSIPGFHITEALENVADLLVQFGGHAAAAGFTIETARLPELQQRLQAVAEQRLQKTALERILLADAQVPLSTFSWDVYHALAQLEPFGYGNPQPIFVSPRVKVAYARAVGTQGQHLKLTLEDETGYLWDAIAFRQGDWAERMPRHVDIAYVLERNEWNGRISLQLVIQDLRYPESQPIGAKAPFEVWQET